MRGRLNSHKGAVEVTNISRHGFRLLLDEQEYFLPFTDFPGFRAATMAAITNVQRLPVEHLYWSDLDVDPEPDAIRHPERYPLIARD